MALSYSDIEVELREISLRDRPQSLYDVSSKGTVPVIVTNDNLVIDESLDIMVWSLNQNKNQTWLVDDSEIEFIKKHDIEFKKWLDKYKYHDRYPEHSKEYYRDKCNKILLQYEQKLSKAKYFIRDDISIIDIAIFPFIRQFANVDYKWFENNYTYIKKWLEELSSSNLFVSIMNKYKTWDESQIPNIVNFNK